MDISSFKNVIILSGAGVSCESGIPDYRSATGVFAKLGIKCFTRSYRDAHPELLQDPDYVEFRRQMTEALPNDSHQLAKFLHDRGKLRRVITQNIDGLYQKTGLSEEMVIEFHGSYVKGNTILYGDPIPESTTDQVLGALEHCDLVIVMGTSLKVLPFAVIPNLVDKTCVRILVDKNANGLFETRDPDETSDWGWYGFCHNDRNSFSTGPIKIGDRVVSSQQRWTRSNSSKWRIQYIFEELCGLWSRRCMELYGAVDVEGEDVSS